VSEPARNDDGLVEFTEADVAYLLRLVRRNRKELVRRFAKHREERENGKLPVLHGQNTNTAKLRHIDDLIRRLESM
jgi:hypothetical protein